MFSLKVIKPLIARAFFSLLDYGDLLFMNAPDQSLKKLDTVYHCASASG